MISTISLLMAESHDEPPAIAYHLWSNKHEAWWLASAHGYTKDRAEAGLYSEAEAIRYVVRSSQCAVLSGVTCMVAAPLHWSGVAA